MSEILPLLEHARPFFQTLAFCAMAGALQHTGKDLAQSKQYYNQCIETGRRIGSHNYSMLAYGGAAAIYLREGDEATALQYTRKFMELSQKFGHRFHFQCRSLFAPVLKLAAEHGITPEFTREMLAYGGYKTQRVYINTLGSFYIAPNHNREKPVKIRTKKARELLAYLLENRSGATRERIYSDLWEHSEANVGSMFHTRRGEIGRAFLSLGAANPVLYENGSYRLGMEEAVCDIDAFTRAAAGFEQKHSPTNAQKVVGLYGGRYLNDMEALWAESTRLRCEEIFIRAAEVLLDSYTKAGEKAKVVELLRQCAGLSHKEQRYRRQPAGKETQAAE